jgi:hypothetical protein
MEDDLAQLVATSDASTNLADSCSRREPRRPRDVNAANSSARLIARWSGLWVTTLTLKRVRPCFLEQTSASTHILCPNREGGCYS